MRKKLRAALKACKLDEDLTWYQCTRHSFASHWVMDGRAIERLREILGHSTVKVTERYAHLRPDIFTEEDFGAVAVDLREPKVIPLPAEAGIGVSSGYVLVTVGGVGEKKLNLRP